MILFEVANLSLAYLLALLSFQSDYQNQVVCEEKKMHKDNRIFEKKSHRTKLIRSNHQLILNPDSSFQY